MPLLLLQIFQNKNCFQDISVLFVCLHFVLIDVFILCVTFLLLESYISICGCVFISLTPYINQ